MQAKVAEAERLCQSVEDGSIVATLDAARARKEAARQGAMAEGKPVKAVWRAR